MAEKSTEEEKKSRKYEKLKTEYVSGLAESYRLWYDLYENGGSDPFWSDGANLMLIRNHILYYKSMIEKELRRSDWPEEYFKPLPPEVSRAYMAKADEIREKAEEVYRIISKCDSFVWLKENYNSPRYSAETRRIGQIRFAWIRTMRSELINDELVILRRKCNLSRELAELEKVRAMYKKEDRQKEESDVPVEEQLDFLSLVG